jgi:hypothetical protein
MLMIISRSVGLVSSPWVNYVALLSGREFMKVGSSQRVNWISAGITGYPVLGSCREERRSDDTEIPAWVLVIDSALESCQ